MTDEISRDPADTALAAELTEIIARAPVGDPYESVTRAGAGEAARACVAMMRACGWTPPAPPA